MKNTIAGFAKPGIWLFSRNAFYDEDFEAPSVTDRDLKLKRVVNRDMKPVFVPPSSNKDTEGEESSEDSDCGKYSAHDESDAFLGTTIGT